MASIYQEIILQHAECPHNFGRLPSSTNTILLNNPLCGDVIQMEVEIKRNKVVDAKFTGKGCAISKASASLLTDFIKGKRVDELQQLDKTSIIKLLGGIELGPNRLKCALLPLEALQKIIHK